MSEEFRVTVVPMLPELDSLSARAIADELESIRDAAVKRGVEFVSVNDLAARITQLRAYSRRRAEADEENYRRLRNADRARNYGIGQEQ